MWVCTSTAPGITYRPVASIVRSGSTDMPVPIAAIFSPSIRTSAETVSIAVTTVPLISVLTAFLRPGRHGSSWVSPVELGSAIPQELPGVAHLSDHVQVDIVHEHLVFGVGRLRHDLAAGSQKYEEP